MFNIDHLHLMSYNLQTYQYGIHSMKCLNGAVASADAKYRWPQGEAANPGSIY